MIFWELMAATRKPRTAKPKTILSKEVPFNYVVPNDVSIQFSDSMTVQHTENEFILSFFQTKAPLLFTNEDRKNLTEVESTCIVRIVVTPAQMAKNVEALKTNFENWATRKDAQLKKNGDNKEGKS